jgi:hypothetical protein
MYKYYGRGTVNRRLNRVHCDKARHRTERLQWSLAYIHNEGPQKVLETALQIWREPSLCDGSDQHVDPTRTRHHLLVRGKRERTTWRVLPELSPRDGLFRARLVRLPPLSRNVTMQLRPRVQWRGLRDPRVRPVVPVQLLVASWSVYKVAQGGDSALRVRRRFQWRWMRRPHARKLL